MHKRDKLLYRYLKRKPNNTGKLYIKKTSLKLTAMTHDAFFSCNISIIISVATNFDRCANMINIVLGKDGSYRQ